MEASILVGTALQECSSLNMIHFDSLAVEFCPKKQENNADCHIHNVRSTPMPCRLPEHDVRLR